MTKHLFIFLLSMAFAAMWNVSGAQGADSLLNSILKKGYSRETVDALIQAVDSLTYTYENEPRKIALAALSLSKKINYTKGVGASYRCIGTSYRIFRFDFDSAKIYYDSAAEILKNANDPLEYGSTLRGLGAVAEVKKGSEAGKQIYFEAIKVLEQGDDQAKALAKEQLSFQLWGDGRNSEVFKIWEELLSFYEKNNRTLRILYIIDLMAGYSINANDTVHARKLITRMSSVARKYRLNGHLSRSYFRMGELYRKEGLYEKALGNFLKESDIGGVRIYRRPYIYRDIASCYTRLGERKMATLNLHKGLNAAQKLKFKIIVADLLKSLAENQEQWHEIDSALYYQKKYGEIEESIVADNARHLREIEGTYLAKQRAVENEKLKKDITTQRMLTLLGAAVALLLIALIVVILKSRNETQNKNRILTEKNQELFAKNNEVLAQNEEILSQQDQLNTAYENAKILSEVGKDIARCLSVEEVAESAYRHISLLMEAPVFGIGLINEKNNSLEFPRTIKEGKPLPPFSISLNDEFNLLVWCIKSKEPLMTNQFNFHYDDQASNTEKGQPSLLICVPLTKNDKTIGLIYSQCYKGNTYNNYHLNLLQNVALHVMIAIENSNTYKIIHEKNEMLGRYNAVKDKLFSVVSHDLRGPMNSLRGLLQFINSKTISEAERNELLVKIDENFKYTQQLLDNVLHWANAQIRGVEIIKGKFDLQLVSNQIISLLSETIKNKAIVIENRIPSVQAFGDDNMIQLVLRNLISNAIKFTPRGGKVSLTCEETEHYLKVGVEDTGVGMPQEFQKNLFQMEIRHTTYGTEKEKGTGLGLSLCKEFIEKNEGKIWVESDLNKGSRFYFTIPKTYKVINPILGGSR